MSSVRQIRYTAERILKVLGIDPPGLLAESAGSRGLDPWASLRHKLNGERMYVMRCGRRRPTPAEERRHTCDRP